VADSIVGDGPVEVPAQPDLDPAGASLRVVAIQMERSAEGGVGRPARRGRIVGGDEHRVLN
jgi:hypothetical protein